MAISRSARTGVRSAVLGLGLLLPTLLSNPAFAAADDKRDGGDEPGESLGTLEGVLLFVVVPIALAAVIWLVVSLPSMVKGPRYRPGQNWTAQSQWIGAPEVEGSAAQSGAQSGAPAELTGRVLTEGETEGGGTSARW